MTVREHEALSCSGLFTASDEAACRYGHTVALVLRRLSGATESELVPSTCGYPDDPLHREANEFCEALLRNSLHRPNFWDPRAIGILKPWLDEIDSGTPPFQIILRFPPVEVETRTSKTLANKAVAEKLHEACIILNDRTNGLRVFDSGTPNNGPAAWTIAYHLLDASPTYELPESQLVSRAFSTLQGAIAPNTLRDVCLNGMFKVRHQFGAALISLDTSGLGSPSCEESNKSLPTTNGTIRLEDAWLYQCAPGKKQGEFLVFDVPLPLAIHMAILATLQLKSSSKAMRSKDAVIVVGERKGWLLFKSGDVPNGSSKSAFLKAFDDGAIDVTDVGDLNELHITFPSLPDNLEAGSSTLANLVGLQFPEDSWPRPSDIARHLTLRGKQTGRIWEQVDSYLMDLITAGQQ